MCGFCLGAAARRVPVLTDGFIATAAAALAVSICPDASGYLFASHRSAEPGHSYFLALLNQEPLLDLGMRVGEGTGAALAMKIVQAAVASFTGMATFEAAGSLQQVKSFAAAIAFLTRIPMGKTTAADVARSAGWFPLVGMLIGLIYCVPAACLFKGHLPTGLIAVLVLILDTLLTGALHFDGLADTAADGFGGGKNRLTTSPSHHSTRPCHREVMAAWRWQ